jgi:amidase
VTTTDDLAWLDAVGQADLVRRGDATPAELVDAAIERIERVNPVINAVVTPLFDGARKAAGDPAGLTGRPLGGVPFLLKDQLTASTGDPLAEGIAAVRKAGLVEPEDSEVMRRYREAGLVLVGKSNLPELAIIITTESVAYGPCRNPWDLTRSVGGSSGGSAAAVAAGLVPVAHATDAGGSIRIPSSMCGIVGLKPSRGRTSQGPQVGDMWGNGSWHVHAVTRTVRDTAAMLDAAAGYATGDPFTAPPPARPFAAEVGADPGRLRVGFMARTPAGYPDLHPDCAAAVRSAATLLESAGHHVEESHPAAIDHVDESAVPAFVSVAASGVAHTLERWGERLGRPIGPDDVEPYTWAFAALARDATGPQVLAGLEAIIQSGRAFASWWDEGHDLLLTPTIAVPPFPLGTLASPPDNPLEPLFRAAGMAPFTGPYNMSGQPAVSLPLHWNDDGLPIGVQLGAAYGRDDVLIRVAAQLEALQPWATRRPPIHA